MKCTHFLAVAAIAAFAACKPAYKATDTTTGTTTTTTPSGTTVIVPAGTQTAFTTQYPTASNVVWTNYDAGVVVPIDWEMAGWTTLDANDYLVRFDMDNENYYAWYDSDGNWIGSVYTMKDPTQLPAAVSTAVNNKYAGYTITDVDREFQKDRIAYEIEMKKDDSRVKLLVDAEGNILKEKMK
jgi:uncharacterized membrane protein YkoI